MTDLVVMSLEGWDGVWRRNQHLVAGLLRTDPGLRVLFVEPPTDPLYRLLRGERPDRAAGLRPIDGLAGVGPGRLWAYQPTKWLPRRIDARADERIGARVIQRAARLGFRAPVLWVNDPTGVEVLRAAPWPALYDITDDWLAAVRTAVEHSRLVQQESVLLARCNEVVVCSDALARNKISTGRMTVIPNAVDLAAYRIPQDRPEDLPAGPTALYVGTLHSDRLDIPLCVATARSLRGRATLVLLGPVALEAAEIEELRDAGAVLLDARPFVAVPAYLQHADVLLVPHVVNAFTDSLDPIKAYEYVAAGRPVVATPVAGFREGSWPGVQVADASEFPRAVVSAMTEDSAGYQAADVPDWSERVDAMRSVIARVGAR